MTRPTSPPDSDTPPRPHALDTLRDDEVTQTSIPTIRAQLERVVRDRERARSAAWGKAVAAVVTAGAMLIGMGVVWEQARQTRVDVASMLVVVARLAEQGATVNARLDGLASENAATRDALHIVENKLWEARPRNRAEE